MPNWKKVIVSGSNAALNSLNVTTNVVAQSFTGSLQGTSSWAVSALTASYADNFTVAGTLTAQTIVVQTITSSTDYVTGSTIFGSQLSNTHQFTGSVSITGSLTVNGVSNLTASNAVTASYALTASNVQGGTQYYVPLWDTNTSLASSYLNQSGSVLKTIYSGLDKGLTLDYNFNSFVLGNAGVGNNTYLQVYDGGSVINIYSPNYTYFNDKVGIRIIPTNPGLAVSGSLEVTGPGTSKFMNSNVQIDGNLFMSGSNRLVYNNDSTNNMLFGMFDGSNIYGPYYQIFGNQYSNITQRGSAEFVYDNRNGGGSGFNIASFNGSTWTRRFRVDDNGAQVTGSLIVTNGITGSLYGTASWAENAVNALSAETASNIQGGATNYIPVFKTPTSLSSSVVYQSGSHIGINITNFTSGDPEALYVFQTHPTSFNVVTGKGNSNNYLQLNIQNTNTGVSASSDIVATADNGTETSNYIDMGINGSNFSGLIGDPNDAYLYSAGNHLHIGNITPGQPLQFFVGGDDTNLYRKLQLNDNNQHNMTGSFNVSGSVTAFSFTGSLQGTSSWAENAITASHAVNALSASYALNATNAISASYATSASHANNATSASYALNATNASTASYVLNAVSASFATTALTASYADNFTVAGTLTAQTIVVQTITSSTDYVTGSTIFGSLLSNTHQFTGSVSITGSLSVNNSNVILTNQTSSMTVLSSSYAISASYAINADFLDGQDGSAFATTGSNIFRGNQTVTGSLFTSGSNTLIGSTTLTGSLNISGSTTQVGNNTLLGNTTLSGSVIISGSANASANFTLQGHLRLDPGQDPGPNNVTASYLFTSASNTATGYDLYYRQNGNLVKFKWIEGMLNTGVLYGGVLSYSGSFFYLTSGSGIIVNHNAVTSSEINPIITYVNWNATTQSIANTGSQNTYVYIDATGSLQQQTSFFTSEQYHEVIPIGRVSHYGVNSSIITGVGNNMVTAYDQSTQLDEFVRAFGPLKVSGLTITPQVGNLHLNIGSGTSFNLGGYYQYSPDLPSIYNSSTYLTSSIIRIYRSGSGYNFDNNGGSYYTTVNPTQWDNGSGVLQTVGTSNWSIQRVFVNPVSGRSHVYYGQTTYATYLDAIGAVSTDDFEESDVTKNAYVFAGYLVMEGGAGNTDLSISGSTNAIIQAGLFRNSVGGSGGASAAAINLDDLADVNITTPSNGQALIYSSGLWINGTPTSASYALNSTTSSYSINADSASYALNATSASHTLTAVSSSYALNATTASHALTTVSASYALTSSNVQGGTTNYLPVFKTSTSLSSSGFYQDPNNNNYVGLFNTAPTYSLDVNGTIRAQNDLWVTQKGYFPGLQTGSPSTQVVIWDPAFGQLYRESASLLSVATASFAITASNVQGGTTNYLARWTSPTTLGIGTVQDDGTTVGIGAAPTASYKLNISGSVRISNSEHLTNYGTYTLTGYTLTPTSFNIGSLYANSPTTFDGTSALIVGSYRSQPQYTLTGTSTSALTLQPFLAYPVVNLTGANARIDMTGYTGYIWRTDPADVSTNGSNRLRGAYFIVGNRGGNGLTSTPYTNTVTGYEGSIENGGGTVNNMFGLRNYFWHGEFAADSTTNNNYGIYQGMTIGAASGGVHTVTNYYAFYQDTPSVLATGILTNRWGLYFTDPNMPSYHAGKVGIGKISPVYNLDVSGSGNFTTNLTATGSIKFPSLANTNQVNVVGYNTSTGELFYQSTSSLSVTSASYAATSSYGGNFVVGNTLTIDQTLIDYASVASSIVGSNNVFTQTTGSYTSAFYKYTVSNGANARSGEVIAVWNGSSAQYTDYSTLDIGSTSGVTPSVSVVGSDVLFNISTGTSGWRLKATVTYL